MFRIFIVWRYHPFSLRRPVIAREKAGADRVYRGLKSNNYRVTYRLRDMRKRILLVLPIVCIFAILIAGCTSLFGSTNTTTTPAPLAGSVPATVSPVLTTSVTPAGDAVTPVPTLSTECSNLITASAADQVFLKFVTDNNIVTRINGLVQGDCTKVAADPVYHLVTTSAVPQTSGLAQARMYLISATSYCRNPDSTAKNNTASDLAKFADKQDQYLAFLYACHIQISANASAVTGGEKLVINSVQGPQTFSGNSNSVKKFSVSQGGYKFSTTYSGNDNITVRITNIYGKTVAEPFTVTGPYSGSSSVDLSAGEYFMTIEATAPYLIKMQPS